MALSPRPVVTNRIAIDVNGTPSGWVISHSGGNASAPVISETIGATNVVQKHIGGVTYAPHELKCATGMGKNFFDWIDKSLSSQHLMVPQGAIHALDTDMNNISSLNFFNALVTNVAFPAVDASSKDAAVLTVGFQSEYTRNVKGGGKMPGGAITPGKQKDWKCANFSLKMDGHPDASKYTSKVESLTMGAATTTAGTGETRDYQIVPGATSFSNLSCMVSESHADTLYQYHENFVIKGLCSMDKEIGASVEYLAADLKTVLFTLNLTGLGIINLTPDTLATSMTTHRQVKAEFYVTEIKMVPGAGMWG